MSSILKVNQIQDIGGNTIVSSDGSGTFTSNLPAQPQNAFRNIIINGDMSIAQRGTSFTSVSTSGTYPVDRFSLFNQTLGTYTLSQDTDVPSNTGFGKSLKIDCTTADAAPASGDYLFLRYVVEGQHLQQFKKGTANAEQFTLSFWVKNTKTGTYTVELEDADNTRATSKSYTIDASDTWEYKILTFPADTTGTFDNDANASLRINFGLAMGSDFTSGTLATSWETRTNANRHVGIVNFADSTSNNFLMTGVQLEVGTIASDFEFLPYDVNLQRCLRYCNIVATASSDYFGTAYYYSADNLYFIYHHPVQMRASPSIVQNTGTDYYTFYRNNGGDNFNSFSTYNINTRLTAFRVTSNLSGTPGHAGGLFANANASVRLEAEL